MKDKSIKAIVWDLDGTLIHFNIDFLRARRNAIKILKKYGVPKEILTVKLSILDNIREAKTYLESVKVDPDKIKVIIREVDGEVIKVEYEAAMNATRIDGMHDVLEFAKSHSLKQAIYTYNTQQNALVSLQTVGLAQFFDYIIGRDNVINPKPHPDHLMHICRLLNVDPQEIVVIGDTDRDIEGALRVGAYSIAICTKFSQFWTKNMFEKADFIIHEEEISSKLITAIQSLI